MKIIETFNSKMQRLRFQLKYIYKELESILPLQTSVTMNHINAMLKSRNR